jgi:transcriptional regulator with XRE-family HTH domain
LNPLKNSDDIITIGDGCGVPYGERLKKVREASGKTPHEIANIVGLSAQTYYDLENCPGDLTMTVSLFELSKIASVLGVHLRDFFSDLGETQSISPEELSKKIKDHLVTEKTTLADFENHVGFLIEPVLHNPSEVLKWNVDCLRFVCAALGVNWLLALP